MFSLSYWWMQCVDSSWKCSQLHMKEQLCDGKGSDVFDFSHVQLPISSSVHSSVQDGIYALGKAHMCFTLSLRSLKFPQCCLWNGFSVRLIDDGPLSSFQGRSSSIFTAKVYCVFKHSKCPPGLTATQQSRSLVPSVVSVNENLHIAHEHFCTKPCVFTAPDTHSAHTQVLTS